MKELRNRRKSAKTDIKIFQIFAVLGFIILLIALILSYTDMFSTGYMDLSALSITVAVIVAGIVLLLFPYGWGASTLGIKKTIIWCWNNVRVIPLGILVFIILLVFIFGVGGIIGVFATPIWLYRARKFLRNTEWVETAEEPTYNFTQPPFQAPPTSHNANFCKHCGNKIDPDARYCKKCGNQI
jgi:hypothetical protein